MDKETLLEAYTCFYVEKIQHEIACRDADNALMCIADELNLSGAEQTKYRLKAVRLADICDRMNEEAERNER